MVFFPNAKINLGLNIVQKRADGFHDIESCFYPVQWTDALEVIPSEKTIFSSTGIEIPGNPETNLCLKAYYALQKKFDLPPVHIHLHKHIPIGAGMGGGSSDAAFTVKLANELFNLKLTNAQMEDYVRPLGSDCAFFVSNKPVIAYEKGDRFKEVDLSLKGYHLVILYPELHISTKEAYDGVQPKKSDLSIDAILKSDLKEWKGLLVNDFEYSLFPKYPILETIKNTLYENGAIYASMTGSGSAVYGLFSSEIDLKSQFPAHYKVWAGVLS